MNTRAISRPTISGISAGKNIASGSLKYSTFLTPAVITRADFLNLFIRIKMKYRVIIPDPIPQNLAWLMFAIRKCGVEYEINEDFSGNTDEGFNWDFSDIPKDWLEEIEEGPVSARDWVIDKYDLDGTCERDLLTKNIDCNGFDCVEIYEAGAADNELRHRPQQTFREWEKDQCVALQTLMRNYSNAFNEVWNASEKNRGF